MPLTRATKERRLASLEAEIEECIRVRDAHSKRAAAAAERETALTAERDWLAQAPVADPLPGTGGDA
jgi:hypothetical protein